MKYCEDDITAIRNIISNIKMTSFELKRYVKYLKLNDEEKKYVYDGIYTLIEFIKYTDSLPDGKIGKIVKMNKFIRERNE